MKSKEQETPLVCKVFCEAEDPLVLEYVKTLGEHFQGKGPLVLSSVCLFQRQAQFSQEPSREADRGSQVASSKSKDSLNQSDPPTSLESIVPALEEQILHAMTQKSQKTQKKGKNRRVDSDLASLRVEEILREAGLAPRQVLLLFFAQQNTFAEVSVAEHFNFRTRIPKPRTQSDPVEPRPAVKGQCAEEDFLSTIHRKDFCADFRRRLEAFQSADAASDELSAEETGEAREKIQSELLLFELRPFESDPNNGEGFAPSFSSKGFERLVEEIAGCVRHVEEIRADHAALFGAEPSSKEEGALRACFDHRLAALFANKLFRHRALTPGLLLQVVNGRLTRNPVEPLFLRQTRRNRSQGAAGRLARSGSACVARPEPGRRGLLPARATSGACGPLRPRGSARVLARRAPFFAEGTAFSAATATVPAACALPRGMPRTARRRTV